MHTLAEEATALYEGARDKVAAFINAPRPRRDHLHQERHRGAQPRRVHAGLARSASRPGDEIVVTEMEHHSNIVPWQMLCAAHRRDAALDRADRRRPARPRRPRRRCSPSAPRSSRCVHQSNVLGTINPVARSSRRAHAVGALVVRRRLASPCRTCRRRAATLGADFARLHRPQDARPDRHRRAVGPPRAARRCRRSSAAAR